MGSALSDPGPEGPLATFKIVIAGGFGVGKTTLVSAISEVRPLRTEEALTSAGMTHDDLAGVENKTTTTVAMDFGRITLGGRRVLYLFGTPGQERFWFMWDDLSYGALGAVVLADTRRLADCFASIDYFEKRRLAFVVAINCFDGADRYDPGEVRDALDLGPQVPVVLCDAREAESAKNVLITLVELVLDSTPDEGRTIRAAPSAPPMALGVAGPSDITDDRV
jgi:signal recognition particle receptor subunit beta